MFRRRWTSRGESADVVVLGTGPESDFIHQTVRARGLIVDRLAPVCPKGPPGAPERSPAARARAMAEHLADQTARCLLCIGPPWWLGIAAQRRAAALESAPAHWLLVPTPDPFGDQDGPVGWHHERTALDQNARASASWIAQDRRANAPWIPNDVGHTPASWTHWIHGLPHPAQALRRRAEHRARTISLGIVLVHHDRPELAQRALASITRQTRSPQAVVVVDAASRDPSTLCVLETAITALRPLSGQLIRRTDPSLGAARTAGVAALSTDWILFLDDDNQLRPDALATFARTAATDTADIWTCWAALGSDQPPPDARQDNRAWDDSAWDHSDSPVYHPLGPSPGLAGNTNGLGDANLLIRRATLNRLNGFDPDPTTGAEDWDLLVRAMLLRIPQAVIPRVLLWKRHTPGGMGATMDHARARARIRTHLRAARIPI